MKYIKPYQVFEASASAPALTKRQINWLDKCVDGRWKLNPQTGLVDVAGNFNCSNIFVHGNNINDINRYSLKDLKGVKFGNVSGDFNCQYNKLTSLEGAPQTVKGNFLCRENQLTTLVGAPKKVGGYFDCNHNQLTSLEGAPKKVGGYLGCYGNPVSESTLKAIFALMEKGKAYQKALEEHWLEMGDEDRVLMYKEMPTLSPEDIRKYKALATYANIKGYL